MNSLKLILILPILIMMVSAGLSQNAIMKTLQVNRASYVCDDSADFTGMILKRNGVNIATTSDIQEVYSDPVFTGNVHIGTVASETYPNRKLNMLQEVTNPLSSVAGIYNRGIINVTANINKGFTSISNDTYTKIDSGVTDSEFVMGFVNYVHRNRAYANDNGTLTRLIGQQLSYGHYNFDSSTPVTTSVTGLELSSYVHSGSIGTLYDFRVGTIITNGTIGEHYSIYQDCSTSKNYFNAKNGIGVVNPTSLLHIKAGTALAGTAPLKLTMGTNLTIPEPGAVEYDGTEFYYTDRYSVRKKIVALDSSTMGLANLISGTVTVTTAKVATDSHILLNVQSLGTVTTPKAIAVTARTAGVSFVISSSDVTDTSTISWIIIKP